jgi:hypothetical protein
MGRGAYTVKPVKAAQVNTSASSRVSNVVPSTATKPTKANTDWRTGKLTSNFLTLKLSETKKAGPILDQSVPVRESSHRGGDSADFQTKKPDLPVDPALTHTDLVNDERNDTVSSSLPNELGPSLRPTLCRTSSPQPSPEEDKYEAELDKFGELIIEGAQSSASSVFSRDSASIYSSGASTYSFDDGSKDLDRYTWKNPTELIAEEEEDTASSRVPGGPQYQQRTRTTVTRRQESQDAASREASSLSKKAAMFKNSRLPPQLPPFSASLPMWSMICRAAQASLDCYDSQSLTRQGTYTPANASTDIKAMIIDDQLIDNARVVIVSIRGTQFKCLADWSVNKDAKPVKPVEFLDDMENACHAGFLQVTKAMVDQVAAQLKQHPASSEMPALLFTGHSAGGAVAAMLYSHMLSISVKSDLTVLASQFSSINCMTFGAPPLSLTPLPRLDHGSGVFLAFANEGDPVLRLSDAAYVKSLAKLMATSPSSTTTAPKTKVVRRSRGSSVIREVLAPATSWEELPLWPTPPPPLSNAGDVILLRDKPNGGATASRVAPEELRDIIFGDLRQHTTEMYIRRVKQVAVTAMTGRE